MIETNTDCTRFQLENLTGDWIVHLVPVEENRHPAVNPPSILFIRNISTGRTYHFAFNHPDSIPSIQSTWFIQEFLLNNPNVKWALDKKSFVQMLHLQNVYDANLIGYLKDNEMIELSDYDTPAHHLVRRNCGVHSQVNRAIPLMKHKEAFDEMADDLTKLIRGYDIDESFIRFNDLIIDTLGELERQGIFVDKDMFKKRFGVNVEQTGLTHSQYNVYTSTGRPSNRFGGVNFAALNQNDGSRKCFRSRYGKDGRIVVLDYTAFHPRIISRLTKYDLSISIDIYEYLAKLYFHKKVVDETDIKEAKALTFRQVYGGVEEKHIHIKWLANLKSYIDTQWVFFQKNGYVYTPFFKRKITAKHIMDPNPPKVFNYILQAVEGELSIPKIKSVLEYLRDKRTKAVLYTYDSVLYDFHKDDGYETLKELRRIMSFDGMFPMKTYIGETYDDVKLIEI